MQPKKHQAYLPDGSSALRVGTKVASSDVNLAYYYSKPLLPTENISVINLLDNATPGSPGLQTEFSRGPLIRPTPSDGSIIDVPDDDKKHDVERVSDNEYLLWPDEDGHLRFAHRVKIDRIEHLIYELHDLDDNSVRFEPFALTHTFVDADKKVALYYRYIPVNRVYEENLSFPHVAGKIIDVTATSSIRLIDESDNYLPFEEYRILYEKLADKLYKAYVLVNTDKPLRVKYWTLDGDNRIQEVVERYMHNALMNESLVIQTDNQYSVAEVDGLREITVAKKARPLKDRSLKIRWRVVGGSDNTLYTPWVYDAIGDEPRDVSHVSISEIFAHHFPTASPGSLSYEYEAIPNNLTSQIVQENSSNGRLILSAPSYKFVPPVNHTPPGQSESFTWTARAVGKIGAFAPSTQFSWRVRLDNGTEYLVSEANGCESDGIVLGFDPLDEGISVMPGTRWMVFNHCGKHPAYDSDFDTEEIGRTAIATTCIWVPRYISLTLKIAARQEESAPIIRVERAWRSSVSEQEQPADVIVDAPTTYLERPLELAPGWNKIILTTNTQHFVLAETLSSQLEQKLFPWEWQMASDLNSSFADWSDAVTGTYTLPPGERHQIVPPPMNDVVQNQLVSEFHWQEVTTDNERIMVAYMDNFPATGCFEVFTLGNEDAQYCANDAVTLPRETQIKVQPKYYKNFENVTVFFKGYGWENAVVPPASNYHPETLNHGSQPLGNGIFRCEHYYKEIKLWGLFGLLVDYEYQYYNVNDYTFPQNASGYPSYWSGPQHEPTEFLGDFWGKRTLHKLGRTWVWVPRDITVTWPLVSSGGAIEYWVSGTNSQHGRYGSRVDLQIHFARGWNQLTIKVNGLHSNLTADYPLWYAIVQAGLPVGEFIIHSEKLPMRQVSVVLQRNAVTRLDPKQEPVITVTEEDVYATPEYSHLSGAVFTGASYTADHQDNVSLTIVSGLNTNSMTVKLTQHRTYLFDLDSPVYLRTRLKPHIWDDKWDTIANLSELVSWSKIAVHAQTNPSLASLYFLSIEPEDKSAAVTPRIYHRGYGQNPAQSFAWGHPYHNDTVSAGIWWDDIKRIQSSGIDAELQVKTHLYRLGCSPRYHIRYGDHLVSQIDNQFGRVGNSDMRNSEQRDSLDNSDAYDRSKENWYLYIDALGGITKNIMVKWDPELPHGVYALYPGLINYYGETAEVRYTIPEYYEQNFDYTNTNTSSARYLRVYQEPAEVINSRTIQVKHRPLFVPNELGYDISAAIDVIGHEIAEVDAYQGLIYLKTRVAETERPLVNYRYLENRLQYRGFHHPSGFFHLDLNPGPHHDFTIASSGIPGHFPRIESISESAGINLLSKPLLLYLRPTSIRCGEQVIFQSEQSVFHTDMSLEELLDSDPLVLPIAKIYVVPNSSYRDLVLIDTRSRGGGLLESISEKEIEMVSPESKGFWDIGFWDGKAYQSNGVVIVQLPAKILKRNGGCFTEEEVENVIHKHLALGIMPLIEYVDSLHMSGGES